METTEIKRYEPVLGLKGPQMQQVTEGKWVRWEDVEKYIREEVLGATTLGDKTVFFTENRVYISMDEFGNSE